MLCLVQRWLHSFLLVNWKMAEGRFRSPIKGTDEELHIEESVPKSTRYKNKWAATIFETWQTEKSMKRAILEPAGVFNSYNIEKVQELTTPLIEMDTLIIG